MIAKILASAVFLLLWAPVHALENRAYADDFLILEWGARSAAMGGGDAGVIGETEALYYNPAGLSHTRGRQFLAMHSSLFRGELKHDLFAASFNLKPGLGMGIGYTRSGVDGIMNTRSLDLDRKGNPVFDKSKITYDQNLDHILYFGMGKALGENWGIGGTAKIYYRTLGTTAGYGGVCDAGAYWEPLRDFTAGVSIRNASTAYTQWQTGTRETAYPLPTISLGYRRAIPYFYGDILVSVQSANLHSFGEVDTRNPDAPANVDLAKQPGVWLKGGISGAEYTFRETISLRAGVGPTTKFTAGAGIKLKHDNLQNAFLRKVLSKASLQMFRLDYAFQQNPDLGGCQILSVSAGM